MPNFRQASDFIGEGMASGFVKAWYVDCRYEKDEFQRTSGSAPTVTHVPADGDRGKFIAAYSVVHLSNGFMGLEYMVADDIYQARSKSKRNGPGSPWQEWFDEMAKKAVVKRHAKRFLPSEDQFSRFRKMVEEDNSEYIDDEKTPQTQTKYINGHRRVELWKKTLERFGGDAEAAKVGLQKLFEENKVASKMEITPDQFMAMMKTLEAK